MSFLTGPVNFRKAVLAWFATFLLYGFLSCFHWPIAWEIFSCASPFSHVAFLVSTSDLSGLSSGGTGMIIGIALASLVVLLLACRRGLPRWKVMATSMLVWALGFGVGYVWIAFGTINPFALNGLWVPSVLFGGAAFLLDFVLGLVLVVGFDKLFERVSRR